MQAMWRERDNKLRRPVITARVIPGFGPTRAAHEARALGGQSGGEVWSFPVTDGFKRDGGVMRLRRAGLMPLELWRAGILLGVWVDYERGAPVMQWRSSSGPDLPAEAMPA